jgi:hypothetical protein
MLRLAFLYLASSVSNLCVKEQPTLPQRQEHKKS